MRKFLSMFAIISLAAPIASNVVACSKVDYRVNKYGNSAYWFLPKLNGQPGNNADSSDVWSEMDPFATSSDRNSVIKNPAAWNVDQRNALGMKILQMLSVALLINAGNPKEGSSNPFSKLAGLKDSGSADYSQLLKNLQIGWQTLDKSVDQEIANKKQSYKDQYGDNKWQSHWNDMLNDSYDGSEQKYKADLLTSSTTLNASQVLENALLGGVPGFQNIPKNTIQSYAQNYLNIENPGDWITQNPEEARTILLGYSNDVYNNNFWKKDADDSGQPGKGLLPSDLTQENLNAALGVSPSKTAKAPDAKQAVPSATYDKANKNFTRNQNNYQNIPSSNNGILSQFQNYALKKYYQDERPLAVSTYQAAYAATPGGEAANKGLENGVSDVDFGVPGSDALKNINNILNKTDDWNKLNQETGVSPTYQKKMITMNPDSSITPEMETAVYGSLNTLIQGYIDLKNNNITDFNKLPIIKTSELNASGHTTSSQLWPLIQRKNSKPDTPPDGYVQPTATASQSGANDMYAVVDLGKNPTTNTDRLAVVYLDDKGWNLAHVDGLQQAVDASANSGIANKNPVDPNLMNGLTSVSQNQDLDNFNAKVSPSITNQTTKPYDAGQTIGDPTTGKTFNNSIYNPYLQYLVNQSYINNAQTLPTGTNRPQFNIMNDLKAFATLDSSSKVGNGLWYTWVYSFFNNLFKQNNDPNWLSQLVNVSPDAPKGTNNTAQWFQNFINNAEGAVDASGLQNLYKAILTLNKTIKGKDANYNGGLFDSSSSHWQSYFNFNFGATSPSDLHVLTKFWSLNHWYEGVK